MKLTSDLIVFITGGASGLGEATVRRLHSQGCRIAIADLNTEGMDTLKGELGADRLICFECNVTKEEDVKNAIEGTVAHWGAIHVALACAGVAWPMMTLTSKGPADMKIFQNIVNINLMGSMYVAKYASLFMSKNKPVNEQGERGVILFVSSVAAEEGQRGQIAYSATKAALNGLVCPMARDLGKYGIRVVSIAPGIFHTPLADAMSPKVKERLLRDTPMGRLGKPEEFAHFAGAIIENSFVNGVRLRLDGAVKLSHL